MKKMKVYITDCEVSDWTPSTECSKKCGGGTLIKKRSILVNPAGDGAQCPPSSETDDCNTHKCPVDCVMAEWGGWSSCSAKCGGGVFERVRDVKRRNAHGGRPCGGTQETQSCNPQSCAQNCKLSTWSPWSACSKACDGGTRFKTKGIAEPESGGGTCP